MAERPIFGVTAPPALRGYKARHAAALAAGKHPLTGRPLIEGHTCGQCVYARAIQFGRTYYKCQMAKPTAGPATDLRLKWPACNLFAAKEGS